MVKTIENMTDEEILSEIRRIQSVEHPSAEKLAYENELHAAVHARGLTIYVDSCGYWQLLSVKIGRRV